MVVPLCARETSRNNENSRTNLQTPLLLQLLLSACVRMWVRVVLITLTHNREIGGFQGCSVGGGFPVGHCYRIEKADNSVVIESVSTQWGFSMRCVHTFGGGTKTAKSGASGSISKCDDLSQL